MARRICFYASAKPDTDSESQSWRNTKPNANGNTDSGTFAQSVTHAKRLHNDG